MIRNDTVLNLRHRRINTPRRFKVIAAEPLITIHRHILCRLILVNLKVTVMLEAYAAQRPRPSLVYVGVPPPNLKSLLNIHHSVLLGLTGFAVVGCFAAVYATYILTIMYDVKAVLRRLWAQITGVVVVCWLN